MTRQPKTNAQYLAVLTMLAGCPDGATEDTLATHGFDRRLLDRTALAGHTRLGNDHFVRGLKVPLDVARFRITESGLALVAPGQKLRKDWYL